MPFAIDVAISFTIESGLTMEVHSPLIPDAFVFFELGADAGGVHVILI